MRIVQLSDTHLWREKPARAAEFEACIDAINSLVPAPDLVVHTGDITHHGEAEDYRVARELLDRLSVPYFVLPGNRDHRGRLIQAFADERYIKSDMPFIQYAVDDFDLRLIVIDSLSKQSNKGEVCRARLDHVEQMVMADPKRPSVVFIHHPPFWVDVGPEPHNFVTWSEAKALMTICKRLKDLRGLYCGHVHRTFETSIGAVPACVVSSVASDVRWDKPNGSENDRPVFKVRTVSCAAE